MFTEEELKNMMYDICPGTDKDEKFIITGYIDRTLRLCVENPMIARKLYFDNNKNI